MLNNLNVLAHLHTQTLQMISFTTQITRPSQQPAVHSALCPTLPRAMAMGQPLKSGGARSQAGNSTGKFRGRSSSLLLVLSSEPASARKRARASSVRALWPRIMSAAAGSPSAAGPSAAPPVTTGCMRAHMHASGGNLRPCYVPDVPSRMCCTK